MANIKWELRRCKYENSKKIYITEFYYDNGKIIYWIDPKDMENKEINYYTLDDLKEVISGDIIIISDDGENII